MSSLRLLFFLWPFIKESRHEADGSFLRGDILQWWPFIIVLHWVVFVFERQVRLLLLDLEVFFVVMPAHEDILRGAHESLKVDFAFNLVMVEIVRWRATAVRGVFIWSTLTKNSVSSLVINWILTERLWINSLLGNYRICPHKLLNSMLHKIFALKLNNSFEKILVEAIFCLVFEKFPIFAFYYEFFVEADEVNAEAA